MLLAVDTATKRIGIALYDGVEVLHEAVWQSPFRHTVELTPAIEQALKSANLTIKNIKAVALTIGPGSYTGLRIGAAAAKGLAMARSIPLIAISTFDVMAFSLPTIEDHQLAVVLQAGRGRISRLLSMKKPAAYWGVKERM